MALEYIIDGLDLRRRWVHIFAQLGQLPWGKLSAQDEGGELMVPPCHLPIDAQQRAERAAFVQILGVAKRGARRPNAVLQAPPTHVTLRWEVSLRR